MKTKLTDLKVGDVVILGTTLNISFLAIYLGNTDVKTFVFYTLDVVYNAVLKEKELKEQRIEMLPAVIEKRMQQAISKSDIQRVIKKNKIEILSHIDENQVMLWYAKSRMMDKSLEVIADLEKLKQENKKELSNLIPYSKIEEKTGMVFKTPSNNFYYVALKEDYYIRLKSKDYKAFCNGNSYIRDMYDMQDLGYQHFGIKQIKTKTNWYFIGETLKSDRVKEYLSELHHYFKWGEWD